MATRLLKNPTKVLTDCDNIDNVDGQRMATVLGKHIAGYDKRPDNTRVDRVLGVDEQGDIRWTNNIPGGEGGEDTFKVTLSTPYHDMYTAYQEGKILVFEPGSHYGIGYLSRFDNGAFYFVVPSPDNTTLLNGAIVWYVWAATWGSPESPGVTWHSYTAPYLPPYDDSASSSDLGKVLTLGFRYGHDHITTVWSSPTPVTAGSGISIGSDNVISVDTSVVQPKLTAGDNVSISNQNVISATDTTYTEGTGIHFGDNNSVNVYNPVPNSPRQFYFLKTTSPEHNGFSWTPLMRTRFRGAIQGKELTADNLTNGYVDLKVDFDLDNILTGEYNTPKLYTNKLVFFLFVDDVSYTRVDTNYPLYGEVDYIQSGIWNEEDDPSFYDCELFNRIEGSELERAPGRPHLKTEIRKLGMASRMFELGGPSFRMHFVQNNNLQVGDEISLQGYVVGLYTDETYFG